MVQKYLCLVLISLVLVGCAFGRKQDYLQAQPILELTRKERLAVGVQDRRPYILDHDKDEDFVGLQRGGYGNPFDVGTQSKQALAEDMAKVLAVALGRHGHPGETCPIAKQGRGNPRTTVNQRGKIAASVAV
ncbi:MAG: hypothetical protein ACREXS_11390 [Gammaproteobacteria bacterium]